MALHLMTEPAGDFSSYGCDQPEPESSGCGGFLLDIFTHSCSQRLVTSSKQKWRMSLVRSHYFVDENRSLTAFLSRT